jgi:hypothetical protein
VDQRIPWDKLSQPEFDERVEALFVRMYQADPDREARIIDGRGGDGGQDIAIYHSGSLEEVAQLKCFPEGFSGGWAKTRRQQIKRSFDKAMESSPLKWRLVTPCNLTTRERAWVESLAEGRNVTVSAWGLAELQAEYARHPDLEKAFVRDQLVEVLIQSGDEEKGLVNADDLPNRLMRLRELASARDPYWDTDIALTAGGVVQTLRPKDPRAADISPVEFTFTLDPSKIAPDVLAAFRRSMDFGGVETVALPGEAVKDFAVNRPDLISASGLIERLEIGPPPPVPPPLDVEFSTVGTFGETRRSLRGKTVRRTRGARGGSLELALDGGLRMMLTVPFDTAAQGGIEADYSPVGTDARLALSALDLITDLHEGHPFAVSLEVNRFLKCAPAAPLRTIDPDGVAHARELMDDLSTISNMCGQVFGYPDPCALSGKERLDIRVARLLLEGHVVLLPGVDGINGTLSEKPPEQVMTLLRERNAIFVKNQPLFAAVQGSKVYLGPSCWYHPSMTVGNADEILEALAAGSVEGTPIKLKTTDGSGVRAYLSDRWTDESRPIVPTPWGVAGVAEHPSLKAITASAQGMQAEGKTAETPEN